MAQQYEYVQMPTDSASWHFLKVRYYTLPNYNYCERHNIIYTITGNDTVISGKTYKSIISRTALRDRNTDCSFPTGDTMMATEQDKFVFGIREENKKVYLFNKGLSLAEYLVFDFNATIGDRINDFNIDTVRAIDTVLIRNTLRKRFIFDADTIIEGIGSLRRGLDLRLNILYQTPYLPSKNVLTCFSYNDTAYYNNPDFSCFYIHTPFPTSITNEPFDKEQVVYPNPFNDKLHIVKGRHVSAIMYSTIGIPVATYEVDKTTVISTTDLPKGLYILVLKDDAGNTVQTKKLFKQ
jgi:hypothetical protein